MRTESGHRAHPWNGIHPEVYPSDAAASRGLSAILSTLTAPAADWHFRFLDYADRTAEEAFPGGICNEAWTTAPMSTLAQVVQQHYVATNRRSQGGHDAAALEPLLQALYSD